MAAKVLDGKKIAEEIRAELRQEVQKLKEKGVVPGIAVVLVGDNPASVSYVTAKERACEEIGVFSSDNRLPAETSQNELMKLIDTLNHDPRIHGILVQLPLPGHINERDVLYAVSPEKDIDGFHPMNVGKMVIGEKSFFPCTPHGIVQILVRSGVPIEGAHAVVVGRSNIVGKPIANMLIQKAPNANATVTLCHTRTRDMGFFTRQADIIIAAAGSPGAITADMVREGAVVIDVGVNRIEDSSRKNGFRLVGDVDFEKVSKKASMITPVPGGVGPMTITMLLYNTVESAKMKS